MADEKTRLLREYVRVLLNEDDGGGDFGFGGGDNSTMMGTWGFMDYGGSLKSIFVDPFLDVGKTAAAALSKVASRTKTLVKVVIETALTTSIPFLQSNYRLIFEQEKKELQKIREKYKDVFKANDEAFTKDVMLVAFMISPSAFITAKAAAKSPTLLMNTLEIFSHGNENLTAYLNDIKKRLEDIDKNLRDDVENYKLDRHDKFVPKNSRGPYMTAKKRELVKKAGLSAESKNHPLREDAIQKSPQQQKNDLLMQVATDPHVKQMIEASPVAKQMELDARRVVLQISNGLLKEAMSVLSVTTLQQLQQLVKRPLGLEKLASLQPEEKAQAEQVTLQQIKAAMKAFYVRSVQTEIDTLLGQGLDPNNLYIASLRNTVSKIQAAN